MIVGRGIQCLSNSLEFFEKINKHVNKDDPVDI